MTLLYALYMDYFIVKTQSVTLSPPKSCLQWLYSKNVTTIIFLCYHSPGTILALDDRENNFRTKSSQRIAEHTNTKHEKFLSINPILSLKCHFTIQILCILDVVLPFLAIPDLFQYAVSVKEDMLRRALLTMVFKLKSACYRFHAKQVYHF